MWAINTIYERNKKFILIIAASPNSQANLYPN